MRYYVEAARRYRVTELDENLAEYVMERYNGVLMTKAQAEAIPANIARYIAALLTKYPKWSCGELATTGFASRACKTDSYRIVAGAPQATVYMPSKNGPISKSFMVTIKPVLRDMTGKT